MPKILAHNLVCQKDFLSPESDDLVDEFLEHYEYALDDAVWERIEELIYADDAFYPDKSEVSEFISEARRRFKRGY